MTFATEDLRNLSSLSGDALKVGVFRVMQEAALELQSASVDDPQLLEAIPRLADLIRGREELASFGQAFSALARASGLWNYIDRDEADTVDRLVADSVTSDTLGGVTLHREQIAVLNDLLAGRNVILSAPTIPIQISERSYRNGMTRVELTKALENAVFDSASSLSIFEKQWVADALDLEVNRAA